jgi:hypothetical protein
MEMEEKIMYNDDVLNLASPSRDPSTFALAVAEKLWSSDELTAGALDKRRKSGRPPLSPKRTSLFKSKTREKASKGYSYTTADNYFTFYKMINGFINIGIY